MYATFILDFISFVLLIATFSFMWMQRKRFYSILPLLPATAFISIGRIGDMLVEHPSIRLSNLFGLSPTSFDLVFAVAGNISDVIGISILIYGFVNIIRYQQTEQKRIKSLETLLPLCANCKKYRTKEGRWMPIEKYLIESGSPELTHGICPECATKLYCDILKP